MNSFTKRELDVLYLLLKGLNNKKISEELYISNHTTKAHIASIYRKLGVVNRVQAAVKCLVMGNNSFSDGLDVKNEFAKLNISN